jgi:SAM-dependent methyltransferase
VDSHDVREAWATRSGAYSPEYYAHHGPDERSRTVRAVLDDHVGPEASVLELGCSSGRHLAHLAANGYEDLAGVEVNADAFDVMADHYPDLAATGTFYRDAIEAVLPTFETGQFDAVFSVETLQHVHPDEAWVFADVARVAGDLVLTVENEGEEDGPDVRRVDDGVPLYHRDWRGVFTALGLAEVATHRGDRDTARAFRWSSR